MTYLNTHTRTTKPTNNDKGQPVGRVTQYFGVYVGFVKAVNDVQLNGRLRVWVPEMGSAPDDDAGWVLANYCSPFAGATNVDSISTQDTGSFDGTQTSYGFWMIPPDINNEVLIMFINGNPTKAIWIGCMFNQYMNNMIPGMAASTNNFQYNGKPVPVAEYNKWDKSVTLPDAATKPYEKTKFLGLGNQGLISDKARGITTSSARRESPSNVFGIITPGPVIDTEASPENIRRKGGSSFIMDDGAGSEYVQLTTKTGAQIRLDETNGFVYLINRDGTSWVQMDKEGNIDIFGAKNISMRAQRDFNIRADRNINIEAGQNIYMKAAMDTQESTTTFTYDVNNIPQPSEIPYWKYVGEGKGQGGNIVMQALNDWHSTIKSNAYLTVLENNLNVDINNAIITTTLNGGQEFNSKMGIKMTTNSSFDVAAQANIRVGANGAISVAAQETVSICANNKLSLNGDTGVAISSAAEVGVTGDTRFGDNVGIVSKLSVKGNADIGGAVSLGGSVNVSDPIEPTSPAPAQSAQLAAQAEIKPMLEKANILATWKTQFNYPAWQANAPYKAGNTVMYNNITYVAIKAVPAMSTFEISYWKIFTPEYKFKRNSESLSTTVTRLPTYEPCPEHESFSFAKISGYVPETTEADKTYEGSGGAGNTSAAQPVTSITPGANNSTIPQESPKDSIVSKDFNSNAFKCQITIHEGYKAVSYIDTVGLLTGGIGHLLRAPSETAQYPLGSPIAEAQIDKWYDEDSVTAIKGAQIVIGIDTWGDLSDIRKRACADLCYNLGKSRFSQFVNFIKAVKVSDWQTAGKELKNSLWYTQVGRRGPNIVTMIVQDVDPNRCDKKFPV